MEKEKRVPKYQLPHRILNLFYQENYFADNLATEYKNLQLIHTSPNIFLVENFLSELDLDYFDKHITENYSDFQDSFTEDNFNDVIYSLERTSRFCFLTKGKDSRVRNIESRAADLAGLSVCNVEPLQIIHYTGGQQFTTHHDSGTLHEDNKTIDLLVPRRLVTLVVYLNDLPFGNGFTEFPSLNLSILPKRGQALMFCNILPNGQADNRVIHKALPVHSPLQKYGLNIWISEKEMPMETYEMHKKAPTRKRKSSGTGNGAHHNNNSNSSHSNNSNNNSSNNNGKKLRLEAAQKQTRQFYEKLFPEEKADLYFQEDHITVNPHHHSNNKNNNITSTSTTTTTNHHQSYSWKGKNYFFGLHSLAGFDIQEQSMMKTILEKNNFCCQINEKQKEKSDETTKETEGENSNKNNDIDIDNENEKENENQLSAERTRRGRRETEKRTLPLPLLYFSEEIEKEGKIERNENENESDGTRKKKKEEEVLVKRLLDQTSRTNEMGLDDCYEPNYFSCPVIRSPPVREEKEKEIEIEVIDLVTPTKEENENKRTEEEEREEEEKESKKVNNDENDGDGNDKNSEEDTEKEDSREAEQQNGKDCFQPIVIHSPQPISSTGIEGGGEGTAIAAAAVAVPVHPTEEEEEAEEIPTTTVHIVSPVEEK
jgi:hypothetical protein